MSCRQSEDDFADHPYIQARYCCIQAEISASSESIQCARCRAFIEPVPQAHEQLPAVCVRLDGIYSCYFIRDGLIGENS